MARAAQCRPGGPNAGSPGWRKFLLILCSHRGKVVVAVRGLQKRARERAGRPHAARRDLFGSIGLMIRHSLPSSAWRMIRSGLGSLNHVHPDAINTERARPILPANRTFHGHGPNDANDPERAFEPVPRCLEHQRAPSRLTLRMHAATRSTSVVIFCAYD